MEAPTLELRPLKGGNGGPTTDDRSSSPYPTVPTPLPPYSDVDHDFATSECNGFSSSGNVIDIDSNNGRETMDGITHNKNEGTAAVLSAFYAKVMILVTAILVFLEVIPSPVPLLFFQGYVFIYLLCGSLLIFGITYVIILKRICPQFIYVEYNTNHKDTTFQQNLVYSNISKYFRIGIFVFGLVTLISDGLEIASLYSASSNCTGGATSTEIILRQIFNLLQIHFLLITAKEIIHAPGFLQYVSLMHLLATNLSMCMHLMIWESAKDWENASHVRHNSSTIWPSKDFSVTHHSVESDVKSTDISKHYQTHNVYLTTNCYWRDSEEVANTEDIISLQLCLVNSTVGATWEQAMPYLYAFKIHYNLIAAVIIYFMWCNLQNSYLKTRQMTEVSVNGKNQYKKKVNCADSVKGLFLGSIVMAGGVISLIIFFVQAENKTFDKIFLITMFRSGILLVTTVAAVLGVVQIKILKSEIKIKQWYHAIGVLQEAEKLAVYCFGICSMVAGGISFSKTQHILLFIDGMLTMMQAFLQSLFIHQVSKKRLSSSHMDLRPGRQVVIFLMLSNLCLWLFESLTLQNVEGALLQRQLFGDIVWPLILRIIMPLVIFYRFHSAVLLTEAWTTSYRTEQN